jgi:L-aminopeptidase/D-esterase-like protein
MQATITRVAGVRVGHAHDEVGMTGCTVVLLPEQTTASVDVRGGAPGTRETDLLAPECTVQYINALCLSGGSAFGLAGADGVMRWLRERGIGFDAGITKVPIVPGAVIFDLMCGSPDAHANADLGYQACENAHDGPVAQGCVGAGMGATVGKLLGPQGWMKSGIGSSAITLASGVTVGALVVNNAFGDIYRDSSGEIIAGARLPDGMFLNIAAQMRESARIPTFSGSNTTLVVVVTDATLSKSECRKVAQMAQDGMARSIKPVHTPYDGDVIFVAATNTKPAPPMLQIGSVAADVVSAAIENSVLTARSMAGIPAIND